MRAIDNEDKNIVVYYHDDMDGRAAAAIVHRYHKGKGLYYPVEYGMLQWGNMTKDDIVYILDFSPDEPTELATLVNDAFEVVWIDHHKTALERLGAVAAGVSGSRRVGVSGCLLTWGYLFPKGAEPLALSFLDDYDIHDPKDYLYKATLAFQKGIQFENTKPDSVNWNKWLKKGNDCLYEVNRGEVVVSHLKEHYKDIISRMSYTVLFEGKLALACNYPNGGSVLFASASDGFDMYIFYATNGNMFTVSLRSNDPLVDVSEIAKKYGGGGHFGAAGFRCKELPFEPLKQEADDGED